MSSSYSDPTSHSNEDHNHFSPDTPDSDSWQQYVCTAPGCTAKERIAIPPSVAPVSLYWACRGCETRQRHVADGGSGQIDMTMIDFTDGRHLSVAEALGRVDGGDAIRMPVSDSSASQSTVLLAKPDFFCSDCASRIGLDEFGAEAPTLRLLANQKGRHGRTLCKNCHMEADR